MCLKAKSSKVRSDHSLCSEMRAAAERFGRCGTWESGLLGTKSWHRNDKPREHLLTVNFIRFDLGICEREAQWHSFTAKTVGPPAIDIPQPAAVLRPGAKRR